MELHPPLLSGDGEMSKGNAGTRSFSITTLGCKLNQYESECIRQSLIRRKWIYRPFGDGASLYIINSCTVTGKSDSRCRNVVRKARRISPEATIIVTGCYAETQPEALERMPEVDIVVGNSEKGSIPMLVGDISKGRTVRGERAPQRNGGARSSAVIDTFLGHSRAFIKIQEGCNDRCSYCIIPRARGISRSVPFSDVLEQVEVLEKNGYREIVLAGVHIGRYGKDLRPEKTLTDLLRMLLEQTGSLRLRLSSIEVTEVTQELIDLIKRQERIAPHLHIPIQSGDDEILAAMKRPYGSQYFREKIEEVSAAEADIAIGTDIIAGFPGESDLNFGNTYNFVRDLPFSYFHVFSFSERPGTPAAEMPGEVSPEVKKRRSRKLIKLGKKKKAAFMKSRTGTRELALVQGPLRRISKLSRAITGRYCEVFIRSAAGLEGRLVPVRITHYSRGRLYGIAEDIAMPAGEATEESPR